jgi:hypothetical protein
MYPDGRRAWRLRLGLQARQGDVELTPARVQVLDATGNYYHLTPELRAADGRREYVVYLTADPMPSEPLAAKVWFVPARGSASPASQTVTVSTLRLPAVREVVKPERMLQAGKSAFSVREIASLPRRRRNQTERRVDLRLDLRGLRADDYLRVEEARDERGRAVRVSQTVWRADSENPHYSLAVAEDARSVTLKFAVARAIPTEFRFQPTLLPDRP